MAISTYSDFLQQLTRLLDGEDIGTTTITPLTLQQIISLGERRIYREVKSRWNEQPFVNVLCSNNFATLPTDFEGASIVHFGQSALKPVTEEFIRDENTNGLTQYFAVGGNYMTFAGPVTDGTAVQGRYYARLPDLSETTLPVNNLFLYEPDLFIFGCLSQAAPFFEQDARIPLWEGRYASMRDAINATHHRTAYGAGRMQVRPSARIGRTPSYGGAATIVGAYADSYANSYA